MELLDATIDGGDPETVDYAWCYDTASAELIMNVYDTLVNFDGEVLEMYIPMLATEWTIENITGTTSPEGLPWYFKYTFKIRTGVPFHGGDWGVAGYYTLSTADVEYSFEREMVQDRDGGPQWMLYEPLLDTWGADGLGDIGNCTTPGPDVASVGRMIDQSVESNATHVWFNLAFPGAYAPFMQILAQSWASVISKGWVNDYVIGGDPSRPDWNGEWGDHTAWICNHVPATSPLDDPTPVMCGTGPFYFETLDFTNMFWSVARFPEYWRGWPADWPAPPYPSISGHPAPVGYVDRLKVTWAFTWETRRDMFLAGDVDFCAVPREYLAQVIDMPGIRCTYPLATLSVGNLFYTFDIDPATIYGNILDYGVIQEDGIARDFFANVNVRKAFSHCMDYDVYLDQAFLGEAIAPATAIIPGLLCYDPTVPGYWFDLTLAETYFKAVPGLWDTGFTITICYNTGNIPRQRAAEMLQTNIQGLNTKFHVDIVGIDWGSYLVAMIYRQLSCFIIGWLADYPDPHNFAFPYYHTQGLFSEWQDYSNAAMDEMIERGIREGADIRCATYHDIQVLAIEDCPSVPLYQAIGRHFERDWVVGWYYNTISPGVYGYNLWKWYYVPFSKYATVPPPYPPYELGSNMLPSDINYDGIVDMTDLGFIGMAYGAAYGPPQDPEWNFRCDVYNDRIVEMSDLGFAAMDYGATSAPWAPP